MSERLAVLLSKMAMTVNKAAGECSVEFRATLASGTWLQLEADERQLAGLPQELAETCRQIFANASFNQASLRDVVVPRLAICDRVELIGWERSVLLERVQVRKEEDRDLQARARLVFVVHFDEGEPWPGRELLGRWLSLAGMNATTPKDAQEPALAL